MAAGERDDLGVGRSGVEEVEREAAEHRFALRMRREVDLHLVLRWLISGGYVIGLGKRFRGRQLELLDRIDERRDDNGDAVDESLQNLDCDYGPMEKREGPSRRSGTTRYEVTPLS